MTTAAENELLTRVGPGTPMGALMRQYWLPACLSTELTADGDPLRLMLLGARGRENPGAATPLCCLRQPTRKFCGRTWRSSPWFINLTDSAGGTYEI